MKLQNFEIKNNKIKEKFIELKSSNPKLFKNRLKMSWSNWGFGLESLEDSLKRLSRSGIKFIELHEGLPCCLPWPIYLGKRCNRLSIYK